MAKFCSAIGVCWLAFVINIGYTLGLKSLGEHETGGGDHDSRPSLPATKRVKSKLNTEDLESGEFFIDSLIMKYGSNNHISMQELDNLIEHLVNRSQISIPLSGEGESKHGPSHRSGSDNPYSSTLIKLPTDSDGNPIHPLDGDSNSQSEYCSGEDWMNSTLCWTTRCLNAQDIFLLHSIVSNQGADATRLRDLSPTILYRLQNSNCDVTLNHDSLASKKRKPSKLEVWGYSFLCVTLINLCALGGMVFLPLMRKTFYQKLLSYMVALAVGTLVGSSLLVLIPECLGISEDKEEYLEVYVWKATTVVAGIYLFFIVERVMKNVMDWRRGRKESRRVAKEVLENLPSCSIHTHCRTRNDSLNVSFKVPKGYTEKVSEVCSCHQSKSSTREDSIVTTNTDIPYDDPEQGNNFFARENAGFENGGVAKTVPTRMPGSQNGVSLTVPGEADKTPDVNRKLNEARAKAAAKAKKKTANGTTIQMLDEGQDLKKREPIKNVAWMVIIGDGIHNFIDGLSIGAAFAQSVLAGVSVSVAVICEELPHELGDFAILLNSGMSMKQALGYNFLSACMCYFGLAVGILIGELTSGGEYIFAIAGGMFLYISLVDMVPEMNHAAEEQGTNPWNAWKAFFLQNFGLLSGYGIILLLCHFSANLDFEHL